MSLANVKLNIVQSIRAFRVPELQQAAEELGHHFLYTNLGLALSKEEVIDTISAQFALSDMNKHSYDGIYTSITDPLHKSGPQPGFVVVLEQIPTNPKFDKEARESLLDLFRDAADYWSDRKVPFRCFYSYSVARPTKVGEKVPDVYGGTEDYPAEIMPTKKLVDVSPQALRMSSPFNAGYWMASVNENSSENVSA